MTDRASENLSDAIAEQIAALVRRRPLVVHLMEDELDLAKLCEAIWPCERTSRIRTNVERAVGRSP